MDQFILGTDLGTGSVKCVGVDQNGISVFSTQVKYDTLHPKPGYAEQDPTSIYEAFVSCIAQFVQQTGIRPAVVSLSSAMHGLMAVDHQGTPLTPLILWSDTRSEGIARRFRDSGEGAECYKNTGTPVHSMAPLYKIIWLREHHPSLFDTVHKFISIKEYIWHRLFGTYQIDESVASATGLLNLQSRSWDSHTLTIAGITEKQLSEIVPTDTFSENLPEEFIGKTGIPASTLICIGGSDGCLSNLGSGALEKGMAAVTIGTSAAVRVASFQPICDTDRMPFSYILDEKFFICGTPLNNGGNVIQWLLKEFLKRKDIREGDYSYLFEEMQAVPAGSDGLIFLPYLHGERAPLWDERAAGAFVGIRTHHNQSHFIRSAFEGICFAIRHAMESLEEARGTLSRLVASGGFMQSKAWLQLLANITGKEIMAIEQGDASAVGAALLALRAGQKSDAYVKPVFQSALYKPDHADMYKKNYQVFLSVYPALKSTFHLLSEPKP